MGFWGLQQGLGFMGLWGLGLGFVFVILSGLEVCSADDCPVGTAVRFPARICGS